MRWHVEVTSMDSADAQSVVVEAESWQKALHAARVARGDAGPISGFSIELLDEGYRAVDPLARRRYDVKRAAEGTALTAANASVASASASSAAPASEPIATPIAPPVAPQAAPAAPAPAPPPAPIAPPRPVSPASVASEEAPRPSPRKPPPPAAKAPSVPPPKAASVPPPKAASVPPPPKRTSSGKMRAAAAVAPVAATPPPPPAPLPLTPQPPPIVPTAIMAVGGPMNGGSVTRRSATKRSTSLRPPPELEGPVPPTQVIFKREHDPNERLPLTYREYVFTVARGVNEVLGERLLRTQLDQVRASIASARPGKFVNLAVFDVVFQGKPPVPPLATLAWKDWTGEAIVAFPRRGPAAQANHGAVPHVPSVPPPSSRPVAPIPPPASAPSAAPASFAPPPRSFHRLPHHPRARRSPRSRPHSPPRIASLPGLRHSPPASRSRRSVPLFPRSLRRRQCRRHLRS